MPTKNASDQNHSGARRVQQAHRQAPWRIQTQRVVIMLIAIILGVSVLWVMLSVTVEAGAAGLEIQALEDRQEDLQRQIASRRTEYAILTSADRMSERAEALGFEPVRPENIQYMVVPSFTGRRSAISARPPAPRQEHRLIKPGYTQSLSEFLVNGFLLMREENGGIVPTIPEEITIPGGNTLPGGNTIPGGTTIPGGVTP